MGRIIIKGTAGLIDCGGSVADLGKEEYKKRFQEQSIKAHVELGQYEDIEEDPERLANIKKAFCLVIEKKVHIIALLRSFNVETYNNVKDEFYGTAGMYDLTEEEYNLLKEVLNYAK